MHTECYTSRALTAQGASFQQLQLAGRQRAWNKRQRGREQGRVGTQTSSRAWPHVDPMLKESVTLFEQSSCQLAQGQAMTANRKDCWKICWYRFNTRDHVPHALLTFDLTSPGTTPVVPQRPPPSDIPVLIGHLFGVLYVMQNLLDWALYSWTARHLVRSDCEQV